jgi:hypothetical protein
MSGDSYDQKGPQMLIRSSDKIYQIHPDGTATEVPDGPLVRGEVIRDAEAGPQPGTPHPDPFLAVRGWEVGATGIYERTGHRQVDRELEAG